ncbi:hypothetical protein BCT54_25385 [Vibrio splendidus]|uniref:DNA binding HTH domain-containing protein n=1 Tax=Vibrio splendidus TaxID=29497 RepID=A0A2N7JNZ8_VIBSP|nr:hypothetical protein BCT54_25385 [Vibrio splendidus]
MILIEQSRIRELFEIRLSCCDPKKDTPNLSYIMKIIDKILIEQVLIYTRGNQTQASKILGIHKGTLSRKYSKLFKEERDN